MYTIEMVTDNDDIVIYHQNGSQEPLPCYGPKLSQEVNEAGSLTFTLLPSHPYADQIYPLSCFIRFLDDGEEIFYGRVIQRSVSKITGEINVTCEGALAFLMDSEIAAYGKDSNGNYITETMTAQEFLSDCIDEHNADIDDDWRRHFTLGAVTSDKRNESETYQINSYTQTKTAIQSNIIDRYGGFIRVRPAQDGVDHLLDWISQYENLDSNELSLGVNVEDMTHEFSSDQLYTVLRPYCTDDDNNVIYLDEETLDVFDANTINRYGRIVKTMEFRSAKTESELRTKAQQFISDMHASLCISSTIQYIDMHYMDGTRPKIKLGDRFDNIEGLSGTEYMVTAIDIDCEHPENSVVTLDNPKRLEVNDISAKAGSRSGSSRKASSRRSNSNSALALKYYTEQTDKATIAVDKLEIQVKDLDISVTNNFRETAAQFERISSRVTNAEDLATTAHRYINGITYDIEQLNGTEVIQNSQAIWQLAGLFDIWKDPNGQIKTVQLKKGTEFQVDDVNGVTTTVGERLGEIDVHDGLIHNTIMGSALWTQRDNITGVCGEYEVVTDPSTGEKTLIIKSGGGMKIRRDNVEYGIYDEQTLTGGLLVQKLWGLTLTTINGNLIKVGDNHTIEVSITAQDLAQFGLVDQNGQFSAGLVMSKINGQPIATLNGTAINVGDNKTITVNVTAEQLARFGLVDQNGEFSSGLVMNKIMGMDLATINGNLIKVGDNKTITVSVTAEQLAKFGLVDQNGQFSAGLIVEKLSDGTNTSHIRGDLISLEGDTIAESLYSCDLDVQRLTTNSGLDLKSNLNLGANSYIRLCSFSKNGAGVTVANQLYPNSSELASHMLVNAYVADANHFYIKHLDGRNTSFTKSNNTLTITDPEGNTFTFSKATQLTKTWSGEGVNVSSNAVTLSLVSDETPPSINENIQLYLSRSDQWEGSVRHVYLTHTDLDESHLLAKITVDALPAVNAGKNAVKVTGPTWTNPPGVNPSSNANTATFSTDAPSPGSGTGKSLSLRLVRGDWNNNVRRVYMNHTNSSEENRLAYIDIDASGIYNEGKNNTNIVGPTWTNPPGVNPSGNSNTVTFSTDAPNPVNNTSRSLSLYLNQDPWSSNKKYVYVTHTNSTDSNRIARIEVDATARYNAGWNAAQVSDPIWSSTPKSDITSNSNTATFTTDAPTPNSSAATSLSLYMNQGSWSSNKKYVYVTHTNSTDANRIARIQVDASSIYTNGANATKVTGPTWSSPPKSDITGSSNTATFTTDAPTPNSSAAKSLALYMNQGSWSSNKKYVYVTHTNSTDANRIARVQVDASSIYENGWSASYNAIGLNYSTDQTINPGGSKTIYPTGKATSSSSSASITSKGVKVTANAVTTTNIAADKIRSGITVKVGYTGNDTAVKNVTGTFTSSSTVSSGQTAATAAKILSGYSAWVNGSEVKGNISSKAAEVFYVSPTDRTISSGKYLSGTQTIKGVTTSSNFIDANIKSGITIKVGDSGDDSRIKKVTGKFTSSSTVSSGQTAATAAKILSGYSAWVDGNEVKGSISSKATATYNVSSSDRTISSGQYLSGAQTIKGVTLTNVSDAVIKSGTTVKVGDSGDSSRIISVVGKFTSSSTVSSGQTAATASKILSGYSAWVNGSEVKGTYTPPSATVNITDVETFAADEGEFDKYGHENSIDGYYYKSGSTYGIVVKCDLKDSSGTVVKTLYNYLEGAPTRIARDVAGSGGGGSTGPTNHTGFYITVTQNSGGSKTVTCSVTYPASSSVA